MPDEIDDDENVVHFSARAKSSATNDAATLEPLDIRFWDESEPPQREWAVDRMVPRSNVTLLSGEGAIGKSILIMQLCVAHASARDWIQQMPEPGPAIYLGAEDDAEEFRRRFTDIVRHYRITFGELVERLTIISLAGKDAVLGVADRSGLVRPTMLFQQLLAMVIGRKPVMIGIDTAADVAAINENDRGQVRQFIGLLRMLAIAGRSAVLLASHPSLQGMQSDSGLSGSTAWHNSVRSRLYLKNATNGDATNDSGLRILEMKKSNYGPHSKEIPLRWDAGVFKPVENLKSEVERAAAEAEQERVFMLLLERYRTSGRNVSNTSGRGFAPSEFAKEPEGEKIGARAFEAAMRRLFNKNKIARVQYGKPSNPHYRIASLELGV